MAYYIALPIGIIVSLAFCIKRADGFSMGNTIFKVVSSLCYIITAVFAMFSNPDMHLYAGLIIFGGVLGMLGDIFLDLKGVYPQDKKTYMYGGFISFLIGHIFYFSAIIYASKMAVKWIVICVLISIAFSIGNLFISKILKQDFGEYKAIVTAYVIFLAMTMIVSIVAMFQSHFSKEYIVLAVGSVMFTLSDVILSGTYFGQNQDTKFHYFINHFTYYAAQYLIASSILFM